MKKFILFIILSLTAIFTSPVCAQTKLPCLNATAHVQDYGDMHSVSGDHITIGTTGEAKRMEAFSISTDNPNVGISYEGHVENIGWQGAVHDGAIAGTKGQKRRIECFRLNLTGQQRDNYDLYYRCHVENYGWLDWAKNGATCGTTQHAFRCEALEIAIVNKDSGAPNGESTYLPAVEAYDRAEGENMYLVNMLRKSNGKAFLTGHPELHDVAEHRVLELGCFSHSRPDGRDCTTILRDLYPNTQLTYHCENIGCSSQTVSNLSHHYFDNWCHNPNTTNSTNHSSHHENEHHAHHAQVSEDYTNMLGDYKYMAYAEASNIGGPYLSYGLQCFGN